MKYMIKYIKCIQTLTILIASVFLTLIVVASVHAELKTIHPRLMSQQWIGQLTTWSNDANWQPYQAFKTYADRDTSGKDASGILFAKALMWKIGKGESYLTSALGSFDTVVNGIDYSNASSIIKNAVNIAYAYDLLYDQLTLLSRKNAVDKFVELQETIKNNPNVSSGYILWNYSIEKWVPAFVAAAAGAGDASNVTNDLLSEYENWKTNYYNPGLYLTNKAYQGAMIEGTYYGTVVDTRNLLRASDVIFNAEGIDVFNQNEWFSKRLTWEWQEYSIPYIFLDPTGGISDYGWYYHAWEQSERLRSTIPGAARMNILLLLTRLGNHPYRGEIYSYLYKNADPDMNKSTLANTYDSSLWTFLYGAKDLAGQAVNQSLQFWNTNVNTAYGPGLGFMRTGYAIDDIYISYKCGDAPNTSGGHGTHGEGTFQLFGKGEDLAIHSGAYDGSGEFPQTADYFGRTVSMNGLIIYDPNERFWLTGAERDNDGGQRAYTGWPNYHKSTDGVLESAFDQWLAGTLFNGGSNPQGTNLRAKLLKADHVDNTYSYVFSDLTRAYNSDEYVEGAAVGNTSKVSKVTREMALIGNKYFVVFDRVNKKKPTDYTATPKEGEPYPYQDKWLLHTQTSYQVNGTERVVSDGEQLYTNTTGAFSTTVNNAKLYGKVVYPSSNYQIRRFNGAKQFWNYQQNVPYYVNGVTNWYDIKWGADRLEIEPTDTNLNHNYLVVLYPASASTVSMPATVKVSTAANNMIGTHIKDPLRNYVAMYSSDSRGANVTGTITYTVELNADSWNFLFDVSPNTSYDVTIVTETTKTTITVTPGSGSYKSSDQGVLTFYVTSTGTVKQPPAPPKNLRIVQ